ncbi:hypothetical protein [Pseudomonas moraviensis]|uniref:hypothetical protein n=1 Tax=Pseudomonas moraviensis TaxID=321662 RepID=UPI001146D0AB|nr:hypothetical protein [Pseudomonas moraviensis]UST61016.1 hypothetical protein NF672_10880 [Pseudomonas moraviensis]
MKSLRPAIVGRSCWGVIWFVRVGAYTLIMPQVRLYLMNLQEPRSRALRVADHLARKSFEFFLSDKIIYV